MRPYFTVVSALLAVSACSERPQTTANDVQKESQQTSGNFKTTPSATLAPDSAPAQLATQQLRNTIERIRESHAELDPEGNEEILILDERAFAEVVEAFSRAASYRPDAALAILQPEAGELRSAVVSQHLSNLLDRSAGGGGGRRDSGFAGELDTTAALDFISSIEDDDDRQGASWLLTKELLQSGQLTDHEVADVMLQLDGVSRRTAMQMVAATANRMRRDSP